MQLFLVMAVGSLLISTSALAQSTDAHAKDRAYIEQAESDWAESVTTKDSATVVKRIIADDYVGVWIDGSHYSKADMLRLSEHPSEYISNHMNGVEIRFYGDAAVAQGRRWHG